MLAIKNNDQKPALSLDGSFQTFRYVGTPPTKCANKLITRLTRGVSNTIHTIALHTNNARQIYSKKPTPLLPFQKLNKQIAKLPAKKIPAKSIEAEELSLPNTLAKLIAANNNHTRRLKTLGAYLLCNISLMPTAYDARPKVNMRIVSILFILMSLTVLMLIQKV